MLSTVPAIIAATTLPAQQSAPPPAQGQPIATPPVLLPPGIAAYRTPMIAMVQPTSTTQTGVAPGGSVPQDRPVVVFRFLQGEATDPIDVASFSLTITGPGLSASGENRTTLFQIATADAWGPLADLKASSLIAPGTYQVTARICSTRGACTTSTTPVTVTPAPMTPLSANAIDHPQGLTDKLLGFVWSGLRRLLTP